MMKTLADTLAEYRTRFMEMRQDKARWPNFVSTAQFLANDVDGVTDDGDAIVYRLERVIDAAREMGGGGITAPVMRSETENDRRFENLMNRLWGLRDQLSIARPASEAKLMGRGIDAIQVPDPL